MICCITAASHYIYTSEHSRGIRFAIIIRSATILVYQNGCMSTLINQIRSLPQHVVFPGQHLFQLEALSFDRHRSAHPPGHASWLLAQHMVVPSGVWTQRLALEQQMELDGQQTGRRRSQHGKSEPTQTSMVPLGHVVVCPCDGTEFISLF